MSYLSDNISLIRANPMIDDFKSGVVNQWEDIAYSNLFYPYLIDSAGSKRTVSVTIDILNKGSFLPINLPNVKWHSKERYIGNLLESEPIWGFKEAHHSTKMSPSISNAFCFSNQKLNFYIETEGHAVGYIDQKWIYCKTKLTLSYFNVINGEYGVICTFEDFSLPKDDSSRYFQWTVPAQSVDAFNDYGLFGMIVLRVDIVNQYFIDASMKEIYVGDYPNKNTAMLQLLTYSASKELNDVTDGGIDLLNSPLLQFEDINNIFEKTIFADFENLNLNGLTLDQKRAIVADQVAVLFTSQHAVLTADYYPSKILGYGMTNGVKSETVINKRSTYAERYPDIYSLAEDRLFGMLASVEKFNFVHDITEMFENHTQSSQKLRDPARILFAKDGILSNDYGINGISFNAYVLEANGAETIIDIQTESQLTYELSLKQGKISIDNINASRTDGSPLIDGDAAVMVSFRALSGESEIKRIRYSIWTKNNLSNLEWVDDSGLSRNKIFDLSAQDGITYNVNLPEPIGDIIFIRLDFECLDGFVQSFYGEQFIPSDLQKPGLTIVGAFQRQDGSGMVDVSYDYFGSSEINNSEVVLTYSLDGISYIDVPIESLRGDFGIGVMPGRNNIVWNPHVVFDEESSFDEGTPLSIILKVSLVDVDLSVNAGVSSNIVILDLGMPEVAVRKIHFISEVETNSSSSSSSSVQQYYVINSGEALDVGTVDSITIEYTGDFAECADIIINTVNFSICNIGGQFVWDVDGLGEHTFTYIGESIQRDALGVDFSVVWAGVGSFIVIIDFNVSSSSSYSSSSSSSSEMYSTSSSSSSSELYSTS